MLGKNVTYVITDQEDTNYYHGYINKEFLKEQVDDFSTHFYVCGPPEMTRAIKEILEECGASADAVVLDDQV